MRWLIIMFLFFVGCISPSCYQRKVREARREEIQNAIQLAEQVKDRRMLAKDMIKILEYRKGK